MQYARYTRNSGESSIHNFFKQEKKRKSDAEKVVNGPDLRKPKQKRYPDAVYLEMRRLNETCGIKTTALSRLLGCKVGYAHSVCEYRIAAYLVPDYRTTPYCNLEEYRNETCNN